MIKSYIYKRRNNMSFRYPNNVNTHKKKVRYIEAAKTKAAVRDAHKMRNNQNQPKYENPELKPIVEIIDPVL